MKVIILHLSDIHFKEDDTNLEDRIPSIVNALTQLDTEANNCVIAVSGDIAFSGKEVEYSLATAFVSNLRSQLETSGRFSVKGIVLVPGNHDCDFDLDLSIRTPILEELPTNISNLAEGNKLSEELLSVSKAFFDFQNGLSDAEIKGPWISRSETMQIGEFTLTFLCHNTALSSQLDERQGQLRFPLGLAKNVGPENSQTSFILTLMHHPYNWFEAENAKALKDHVRSSSDLVLTGHEHEEDAYTTVSLSGEHISYIEGAPFNDHSTQRSGFIAIVVDLERKQQKISFFEWADPHFTCSKSSEWKAFIRNEAIPGRFNINDNFRTYIEDIGTGFTHPNLRRSLKLDDVYIFPDIKVFDPKKKLERKTLPAIKFSNGVPDYILTKKRVLILGGEKSGKSSIAKQLFARILKQGDLAPILVSGDKIRSVQESKFSALIKKTFSAQYSLSKYEEFKNLPPGKKALIIDDWERTRLNRMGQTKFIKLAEGLFETILVIASDLYHLEEITETSLDQNPFAHFTVTEIRPFGFTLRGRLIEKWYTLGKEDTIQTEVLEHSVRHAEKTVLTLLCKNILPSYPVVILSVLHMLDVKGGEDANTGLYGQLYEALITTALANATGNSTSIDTLYTFISLLAYELWKKEKSSLTRAEFSAIAAAYFKLYRIRLSEVDILKELEEAQILSSIDNHYRFRYKYCFYYFVAKYYQGSLQNPETCEATKAELLLMADRLYFKDHTHILMFVVFLTKNHDLIERIMRNGNQVYGNEEPCNFEEHVTFINKLFKESSKLQLPPGDPKDHREEHRRRLDEESEEEEDTDSDNKRDKEIYYDDSLDEIIKLNISFKQLQLLGQVLRNFPGSLLAEQKIKLTQTAYNLGLRTLRAVLKIAERNIEEFRTCISQIIKQNRTFESEADLAKATDEIIIGLTKRCAYAFLKRISYAVGLEILEEIYDEVLKREGESLSVRLIDVTVKLDHFEGFPEDDIEKLVHDLKKDYFCTTVLRDLVAQHLYLFSTNYATRQKMGSLLGIETTTPVFLDNPDKGPGEKKEE